MFSPSDLCAIFEVIVSLTKFCSIVICSPRAYLSRNRLAITWASNYRSAYFSVIPGRIQMERFIPVENFLKKGNTFQGISFFPLLPEFPKFSEPFVHSYSARLFTVILLRKNAKDMKDGGRFPKRFSLQCVSLLVGSVGGRFRTQLQLTKTSYVLWSVLVFFFDIPACFRLSYIVGKSVDADCWFP